jgi:lysophospholipase L1-like esterase
MKLWTKALLIMMLLWTCACNTKESTKSCSLLSLGDSYTEGTHLNFSEAFPSQLAEMLKKSKGCEEVQLTSIAKHGWTSEQLLAQLPKDSSQYQWITVLIGVNDQYDGVPIHTFEQNLIKICQWIAERTPPNKVVLLTIPDYGVTPFSRSRNLNPAQEIDDFNKVIVKIAGTFNFLTLYLTTDYRKIGFLPENLTFDSLHPSSTMYEKWAQKVDSTLN